MYVLKEEKRKRYRVFALSIFFWGKKPLWTALPSKKKINFNAAVALSVDGGAHRTFLPSFFHGRVPLLSFSGSNQTPNLLSVGTCLWRRQRILLHDSHCSLSHSHPASFVHVTMLSSTNDLGNPFSERGDPVCYVLARSPPPAFSIQ